MEGRIVQKLECRPHADNTYYKLKSESIRKASMPQRKVQQLDRIVLNFKPVSDHKHNVRITSIFIINLNTSSFSQSCACVGHGDILNMFSIY